MNPLLLRSSAGGAPRRDAGPTCVLIADDDPDLVDYVSTILEGADYRVVRASSSQEAWERVLADRPQVAVLDVMMPGGSGWELSQRIKLKYSDQIAVVMLTARNSFGDALASAEHYADLHLNKPCHPEELLDAVASLVEETRLYLD